ncbi:hypothetical protein GCM10009799_14710 [Nocardiopsis rhodophaea]|uniref:Uncharacterized protein n=1 Tax=Nocardiopsis rhodophaea TaxID=280238 RepID=A0ABN2SP37_9ACTN
MAEPDADRVVTNLAATSGAVEDSVGAHGGRTGFVVDTARGQRRDGGYVESALPALGQGVEFPPHALGYDGGRCAADVVRYFISD